MAKKKEDPAPKTEAPPAAEVTAFAVVRVNGQFYPMRLTLDASTPIKGEPLHEGTIYEALAYEYLQGDVLQYWEALQTLRAAGAQ